jgi:hypothetical protein
MVTMLTVTRHRTSAINPFMQGIKSFLKEVLADRQGKTLSFTSIRNKTRTHAPFLVANVLKNFIFIL